MSTELLLVEPPGHVGTLFSGLKALRLRVHAEIQAALSKQLRAASLLIAPDASALDLLLGTLPSRPRRQDLRLLLLDRSPRPMGGLLHAHFRFVVSAEAGARLLPAAELVEVLSADNRADLFIGGEVIRARPEILLYRGNLEPLAVPLRWFNSQPGESAPDPTEFAVTDYGQTVRLGSYEASTDAILYEFDDDYRAQAKKRMMAQDDSLGGSIRRLRLQKGLRQADFPGITSKEIARIEKGLVKRPHQETLKIIARKAGVPVGKLASY
jgi:hypothetical protein